MIGFWPPGVDSAAVCAEAGAVAVDKMVLLTSGEVNYEMRVTEAEPQTSLDAPTD
jgi:hypothetical protein